MVKFYSLNWNDGGGVKFTKNLRFASNNMFVAIGFGLS